MPKKNEAIAADAARDDIDIVVADRYGLSLVPVQEPALDDPLDDLVERFDHLAGGTDDMLVLTAARSALEKRYRKREGEEPPADFLAEVERIQRNYRALEAYADLRYVDTTGQAVDTVQRSVRAALSLG